MNLKEFYECLGLIYGDGSLKNMVNFSNTSTSLVNKIIKFFRNLGVPREKIKLYIQVYYSKEEVSDIELIKYWDNKLDWITEKNILKVTRKIRTSKRMRNRKEPPKYGLIQICIYSKELREELIRSINSFLSKPNCFLSCFLRGLIAAEGSIKLNKNVLREVRISSTKLNVQKIIRNLLVIFEIKPANAIYKNYISVSHFSNFRLINYYNLCSLHPEKEKLFVSGFKELERLKCLSPGV